MKGLSNNDIKSKILFKMLIKLNIVKKSPSNKLEINIYN